MNRPVHHCTEHYNGCKCWFQSQTFTTGSICWVYFAYITFVITSLICFLTWRQFICTVSFWWMFPCNCTVLYFLIFFCVCTCACMSILAHNLALLRTLLFSCGVVFLSHLALKSHNFWLKRHYRCLVTSMWLIYNLFYYLFLLCQIFTKYEILYSSFHFSFYYTQVKCLI